MAKFVVNHAVEGIQKKEIDDVGMLGINNDVAVVLFGSDDYNIPRYYTAIKKLITSGCRVLLIYLGDGIEKFRSLSNLMHLYGKYDLYTEKTASFITKGYIDNILKRTPTFQEVQNFFDGQTAAYGDIDDIMLGMTNLSKEGNLPALKVFVEEHLISIQNAVETINTLRKNADSVNSGEVVNRIAELTSGLERERALLEEEIKTRKSAEESAKIKGNKLEEAEEALKEAKIKLEMLEKSGDGPIVIKTYTAINTASIRCKCKCVVYFKELSKIPYINTLVSVLFEMASMKKKKVKLMIYDPSAGLSQVYKPLNVVGTSEFMANKSNLVGGNAKFVVVEPNPVILESVLTYDTPSPYDIVIVYDRMRQATDLVTGNNVHKFWVIGSKTEYKELKNVVKITDTSSIITRVGADISLEALDIPEIEKFSSASESAKMTKYLKLTCSNGSKQLMKAISDKIMLDKL